MGQPRWTSQATHTTCFKDMLEIRTPQLSVCPCLLRPIRFRQLDHFTFGAPGPICPRISPTIFEKKPLMTRTHGLCRTPCTSLGHSAAAQPGKQTNVDRRMICLPCCMDVAGSSDRQKIYRSRVQSTGNKPAPLLADKYHHANVHTHFEGIVPSWILVSILMTTPCQH